MMRKIWTTAALLAFLPLAGCDLLGESDSPAKTPPTPTPFASLTPGVYRHLDTSSLTEEEDGVDASLALRVEMQLRTDSTYVLKGYLTSVELEVENQLVYEEKGSYRQVDSVLIKTGIRERVIDYESYGISRFEIPDDGVTDTLRLRAPTSASFQSYDDEGGYWGVWSRLEGAADLKVASGQLFLDPERRYSLELPSDWDADIDQTISGGGTAVYDLFATGTAAGGVTPNVIAQRTAKNAGQTLEARMNAEATALQGAGGITILSKQIVSRDGTPAAEILLTQVSGGKTLKQKLVLFERAGVVPYYLLTDLQANFDGNAKLLAIDSSLAFF